MSWQNCRKPSADEVNVVMAYLVSIADKQGVDRVTVTARCDGRVEFVASDYHGFVKWHARGDADQDGLTSPSKALFDEVRK